MIDMSEQPDVVIVRDMNFTGEISVGTYSTEDQRYRMDDGDEYTREQLEQEYEPMFLWSENPNNARWLSLAHVLCSDLGTPVGHIEDRLNAAIERGSKCVPT